MKKHRDHNKYLDNLHQLINATFPGKQWLQVIIPKVEIRLM